MASLPLMNTQFAQLGAIDALESEGLMDKVTGMSGVSSGAFITALAASKNRSLASSNFRSKWPGWSNMGSMKDPEFSANYRERILDQVLPQTFEELQIPLAVVAVHYLTERAAATIDNKMADPVVVSDGDLPESIIASSSAMIGPGCPKCHSGFQAKHFRGFWPVADGFLKDEYGTLGLHALAPCENLVHIMPQNYPQQLTPTLNSALDTSPKNVVSLGVDIPSSGIMSMMWDQLRHTKGFNFLKRGNGHFDLPMKAFGANEDETWEKLQYETAYTHMKEQLDQPMMVGEEPNHFFVDLNLMEHWKGIRGKFEEAWDKKNDAQHSQYWLKTIGRRNEMVGARNKKVYEGRLSYRPGGNGKGAPKVYVPKPETHGPRGFSTQGAIW
eukprot:gnl/MRDRNA2_/MRDRNA2_86310_c0_seq1.p1 gnl/MRDRNA2_/MRDRNA2_86310_c0~~gnl/MRDRNA2_/MRDRNA2_86310_c0_seq1.p1  ORF type:complete len:448 (+),score=85.29 gnl/MRDRNA2_/MRDRNA2_86310_c0_seq1:192-1346(+)